MPAPTSTTRRPMLAAGLAAVLASVLPGGARATPTAPSTAPGRRVALSVGVSAYAAAPPLPGAVEDARAVAGLLRAAGFAPVVLLEDPTGEALRGALAAFAQAARGADAAVLYYAGHGAEASDAAYMIPADAALARPEDLAGGIDLDAGVRALQGVKGVGLALYDASRTDPFAGRRRPASRTAAPAAGDGGGDGESGPGDVLVAYACRARAPAERGPGGSPFAAALRAHLTVPGLDLRLAMARVRDAVLAATDRRQEPFLYGSLSAGTVALVPRGPR